MGTIWIPFYRGDAGKWNNLYRLIRWVSVGTRIWTHKCGRQLCPQPLLLHVKSQISSALHLVGYISLPQISDFSAIGSILIEKRKNLQHPLAFSEGLIVKHNSLHTKTFDLVVLKYSLPVDSCRKEELSICI